MFVEYLKSIGGTWKYVVGEALLVLGILVGLNALAEPPAWVYWTILSTAALIAPYWAYRDLAKERDALEADQPLRIQLQGLLQECEKHRASGSHPYDAEALADAVLRLCAAFPNEPCLSTLRTADLDLKTVTAESIVLRVQRDLGKALAELDKPPGPSNEERLQAAKKLIRNAVADFYSVIANWSYSPARQHLKWAERLLRTVFLDGAEKAKNFRVIDASSEDIELRKERGLQFFEGYAETLGRFEEHLQLPPGPQGQCLNPEFAPKAGLKWRDY